MGPPARPSLEGRIAGMLLGAACGDVVGMPAAGLTPAQVRAVYGRIDGPVRPAEGSLHAGLEAGAPTDDTELLLVLGEAICAAVLERGGFTTDDVVAAVVGWVGDRLEDPRLGPSTVRAVRALREGVPPEEAGREGDTDGAAARIPPVAALHAGSPGSVDEDVVRVCLPTHGTNLAIAAAAAVAAAEAAMLGGSGIHRALREAIAAAERCGDRGAVVPGPSVAARIRLASELARGSADEAALACAELIGAGVRAVEAVPTALGVALAAEGDPVAAILAAANAGDDADTVAAIAGAVCGAGAGAEAFPEDWLDGAVVARLRSLASCLTAAHDRLSGRREGGS